LTDDEVAALKTAGEDAGSLSETCYGLATSMRLTNTVLVNQMAECTDLKD